jgi:epoxyqueuosine reductase
VAGNALVDELRLLGAEHGLDAVGIAPATPFEQTRLELERRRAEGLHGGMAFTYRNPARSTEPGRIVEGARAIVVGARRYPAGRDPEATVATGPQARVARYASADYYRPLRTALEALARRLQADGWAARVVADDNALVDREAARRAGLGWYGKNSNLLLPGQGSWFVLGGVVTDAPLPPSAGPVPDGCGACRRCLSGCPTDAIVAPGVLDARRCLAWLLQAPGWFPVEFRSALGDRIYGCDDCQEVCPENRLHADEGGRSRLPSADDQPWVDILEMLAAGDDELLARFGRWYIPQRQARYLRRNALVVLGNIGDGRDPNVEATLRRCLADPDPIIRGHAVWASARLNRLDLVAGLDDDDPEVQRELQQAPLI